MSLHFVRFAGFFYNCISVFDRETSFDGIRHINLYIKMNSIVGFGCGHDSDSMSGVA